MAAFGPLVTPWDVLGGRGIAANGLQSAEATLRLVEAARYVCEFLAAPHPDLGRSGAVCPFIGRAMDEGLIHMTVSSHGPRDEARLLADVQRLAAWFRAGETTVPQAERIYRGLIMVFPNLPTDSGAGVIERVQKASKPAYVRQGLMIGQFYPDCAAPGLHNADFRPMRSPGPSLAIRNMTVFDAPFMLDQESYIDAFIERFGAEGRRRLDKLRTVRPPPSAPAQARFNRRVGASL
jgi:hypothetical protein